MTKATIIFFPNIGKKSTKNDLIPMYARILFKGKEAEARLNLQVAESDLHKWNKRVFRFDERKSKHNEFLKKYHQHFDDIVIENLTKLNSLSASDLRDKLFGKENNCNVYLLEYCKRYYKNAILSNGNLAEGTKKNYFKAINHLEKFLLQENSPTKLLTEANTTFGISFYDYLLTRKLNVKVSMTEASAAGNIKKLKRILNRAHDEGLIPRNPFSSLKLKTQSPSKEKLTLSQVKAIYNLDLRGLECLEKIRDIFLFAVCTGLSYSDAIQLKNNQIQKFDNGEYFLQIPRQKTNEPVKEFLVSYAMKIVEKYQNAPDVQFRGAVLPNISNQQLNLRLKILADRVGITTNLTSHSARHTFRQLLAESEIFDFATIKTMMGWSRKKDIDSIYHNVTEKQLLDAKNKFQLFLTKILS